MLQLWKRLLSLLGIGPNNGDAKGRQSLEKRLFTLPRLSDWQVDPYHSTIEFRVMHMGLAEVRGRFRQFQVKMRGASPDFSDLRVEVEIDTSSIQTDMEARDAHLRSPEFLDSAQYPKAYFKSTQVEWRPLRTFLLMGNMTLKGHTHPIILEGKLESFVIKDMFGQPRVSFKLSAPIDRRAWGLTWQIELEGGEVVVDNTVHIEASVEITTPQALAAMQQMLASMMPQS